MRTLRVFFVAAFAALVFALPTAASAALPAQVVTGWDHACTLADSGLAQCWGYNQNGELGRGFASPTGGIPSAGPVTVTSGFARIATAADATCVVNADSTVSCWGYGLDGLLGNGANAIHLTPVAVTALSGVTDIWSGSDPGDFCAKKSDQTVWCWGGNAHGQLGSPAPTTANSPIAVPAYNGATKIAFASDTSCAVLAGGNVRCSGADAHGEMGNGPGESPATTPADVAGIGSAVDIAGSQNTVCAAISGGTVQCWGSGAAGRLANGSSSGQADSPGAAVDGLTGVRSLGSSTYAFCANFATGSVSCWGDNSDGGVGVPAAGSPVKTPVSVPGLTDIVSVAKGDRSDPMCALQHGGAVFCWGYNGLGDEGVDTNGADVTAPSRVANVDLIALAYPGTGTKVTQPVKTKLDKKKKTYSVSLKLTTTPDPLVLPTEACVGTTKASVKYSYTAYKIVKHKRHKVKKTKTFKKSGALALDGGSCSSSRTVTLPVKYFNGKKIKPVFTAAGNGSLQPITAKLSVKLPKVRTK